MSADEGAADHAAGAAPEDGAPPDDAPPDDNGGGAPGGLTNAEVIRLLTLMQQLTDALNAQAPSTSGTTGLPARDNLVTKVEEGLKNVGRSFDPPLPDDVTKALDAHHINLDPTLPEDLVPVVGLVGLSIRGDNYRRLYLTIQLNEYIEFHVNDLVAAENLGHDPLSGTMVWLKREANVRYVRSDTISLQRGFLQGGIIGSTSSPGMPQVPGPVMGGGTVGVWCGGGTVGPWCGGGTVGPWCGGGTVGPWCGGGTVGAWCGGGAPGR